MASPLLGDYGENETRVAGTDEVVRKDPQARGPRIREVNIDFRNPSVDTGKKTIDERFIELADSRPLSSATATLKAGAARAARTQNAQVLTEEANQEQTLAQRELREATRKRLMTTKLPASLSQAKIVASRARASGINLAAVSWASYLWLFVQVPFAILGAVSLGVMGLISGVTSATGGDPGFWANILNTAASAVLAIFATIGIDFLKIAEFAFLISYVVVLAIGFITLFTLYLQYTLGLLRPLSGQADGLKFGMLLLAVIGYCIPLANLFPWATAWMMAVWFYPR